jgi:hypothetical protein
VDSRLDADSGLVRSRPHKSPSRVAKDLRRRAQHVRQRTEEARKDRRGSWADGGQASFAAERQEATLGGLREQKRGLRREVYSEAPDLEGRPFFRGTPGGRA